MKKICLMVLMTIVALTASAQVEKGFRTGIRVNVGMNKATDPVDTKFALSYGVDWVAEYNFSSKFYINTGLGFENMPYKSDYVDGTVNAWSVTLPIHLGTRFALGDNSSFFIQVGPKLSYGVKASDIDWYDGGIDNYYDNVDRFEVGAGGRLGVEFGGVQVGFGANYGFTGAKDLTLGLGIAYMF